MRIDNRFGFVRVASASPVLEVANTEYNADRIIDQIKQAKGKGVEVLLFPELSITSYTCGDLFFQQVLRDGAKEALRKIAHKTLGLNMLVVVGVPFEVEGSLYNCAAVIHRGKILGLVPKLYPPNYRNFQELRFFTAAGAATAKYVMIDGERIPFGFDLLFPCSNVPGLVVGVEVCEDGWVIIPPSAFQSLAGSTLTMNLSASNDTLLKAAYRRQLFSMRSATNMGAYMYASAGVHESSTDMVFGGHLLICENGSVLAENERFEKESTMMVNDIDVDRLIFDRMTTNSYAENKRVINSMLMPEFRFDNWRRIEFSLKRVANKRRLIRYVEGRPFVPSGNELLERCKEITNIQKAALTKRIRQVCDAAWQLYGYAPGYEANPPTAELMKFKGVLGLSGGLDSALTGTAAVNTFIDLGIPLTNLIMITMPGFGTTARTKNNAWRLMKLWGVTAKEIDIRPACMEEMLGDNHKPFGIDLHKLQKEVEEANKGKSLTELKKILIDEFENCLRALSKAVIQKGDLRFENVQARMRTLILMQHGFVLGTGDLSELAKGWCTFNGDHMSMYNVNVGIPKTLVKWLVAYMAHHRFDGEVRETLLDIVGTPVSPELLPLNKDGTLDQKTEDTVGPYELTDFYLYNVIRFGFSPDKILYLADHATFESPYLHADHRRWLIDFFERFFRAQFKRSALPDGPKVGSISLSPRSDWRMPTDACAKLWLNFLDAKEREARIAALVRPPIPGAPVVSAASTVTGEPTMTTDGKVVVVPDIHVPAHSAEVLKQAADFAASAESETVVRALGVIDAQNDFCSATHTDGKDNTARLPVEGGEEIGKDVGRLQAHYAKKGRKRFASRDWHPADMFNFTSQNPEKKGYVDMVADEDGEMATVYPDHCVVDTWGAAFLPGVDADGFDRVFSKGTSRTKDSYSVCGNKDCIPWLKEQGITHIDLCGLVFRICVGYSAIDLAKAGFKVRVIKDATRDLPIEFFQKVIDEMKELGVEFVTVEDVLKED